MRSRPTPDARTADVARRRLEALTAELVAARGEAPAADDTDETDDTGFPAAGRHALRPVPEPRRGVDRAAELAPGGARSLLGGRPHLGAAQVGLVALVVALGLLLSAWWLVRASGDGPGDVAPPRVSGAAPAAASSSGAPSPTADGPGAAAEESIVVDVVGKVRRPGIAVLPVGARVVDAVEAAGGVRRGVDPATVNMARLLTDGEQVVVGGPGGTGPTGGTGNGTGSVPGPASAGPAGALVNLNTADQATLETLPGVGPVTAAAILEWRVQHGAFTSVDELLEVSGIGDATLAEIAPHVTL